ncbi:DUF4376 domain-containing protein [Kiloniella sp. b19]|uniref:DUF4376 domain-containing protein n=1 Tax=Kiloniella sp. GXU_MW_B19 TaxID=3141326 RepID=UPI0031E03608
MYAIENKGVFLKLLNSGVNVVLPDGRHISSFSGFTEAELNQMGVYLVEEASRPDDTWHNVIELAPVKEGNRYKRAYDLQPKPLEEAKRHLKELLTDHFKHVLDGGWLWQRSAEENHVVDSDMNARLNMVGLNSMAAAGAFDQIDFTLKNNTQIQVTATEMQTIANGLGAFSMQLHAIKQARRTEIDALPDDPAVWAAYDVEKDFPPLPLVVEGADA